MAHLAALAGLSGGNANIEQVLPVALDAPVPWHNRKTVVEPPAIDAVRNRVPVNEIQDMIGQQEGGRRQNGPRLVI
ncbi:hypothetical protein [Marivita sp. S0852]|uniref:hypothetical protein n=1 Tax=Marivita sp. S0852 TaxID=3373893 RepID=UPI003981C868